MTESEIKWASQHDWFISASNGVVVAMDSGIGKTEFFTDFKELKNWAGY